MGVEIKLKGFVAKDPKVSINDESGRINVHLSIAENFGTKENPITQWYNIRFSGLPTEKGNSLVERAAEQIQKGYFMLIEGRMNQYLPEGGDGTVQTGIDATSFERLHFEKKSGNYQQPDR